MKRCPTCNQTFTDEWLTFCTQDGTALVAADTSVVDPPVTLVNPSMPPSVSPLEQPTMDMPGKSTSVPAAYNPPQSPSAFSAPPPPAYPVSTEKNMALLSLILGVISITIGFCCYFGVLTAPVAIGLGVYALSLIKKDPNKYGGKGMAIAGIITGALYFIFLILIILFYGLAALMGNLS
ncbi:MAG TPA: DUF4190 domain-containing protein [Pyrinomonadaceae bacterium]